MSDAAAPSRPAADPVARARALLAQVQYLTIASADADGTPWSSTVWYTASPLAASSEETLCVELLWLSRPEARHSLNLRHRPEVGISIFDSGQPAGTGDGLQLAARAALVGEERLDHALAVVSDASLAAGGGPWTRERVAEVDGLRLYGASIERAYLLEKGDRVELPVS
jgi:hypothetical protein